jgi:peptidoglycan biosynthesis protein MviN/MurJ (putative lipid II flippase)
MLPQGIFSVAITTVLFPSLSRLAARNDTSGFRDTLGLGLRQIAFLLIPAGVMSAVLAEPITRIVYQRGHFEPAQTPVVAAALAAFSAGLFFNGVMLLLNRGFFSLQSNWIPTAVALGNLGINAALDAAFYRFGTWGIPLATSCVNVAGSALLLALMRRRLGRLGGRAIADSVVRIVVGSAALAGAAYGHVVGPRRRARPLVLGSALRRRDCAARRGRRVPDRLQGAQGSRARGVASFATPTSAGLRCPKTAYATSRSSPTSTMGSRRWPTASSS